MSRAVRVAVIAAAWAVPAVWVSVVLFSGPSDGTTISPATGLSSTARWGGTVTVVRTYGDAALRPGDVVLAVDGRSLQEWWTAADLPNRQAGDRLVYDVRRPGTPSAVPLDLAVGSGPTG